ncbi:MAG: c-type cytochrome domain-containing protein, partial [Gemmata sp.]
TSRLVERHGLPVECLRDRQAEDRLGRAFEENRHGAVGKPKGGLDLRSVAAIMKGGEGGPSVKPGDPEKSILYISMKPPNATMPPDGKQGPNEKELLLIYNWIGSGAKPRRTVRRRR